jgi:hypothetical protein
MVLTAAVGMAQDSGHRPILKPGISFAWDRKVSCRAKSALELSRTLGIATGHLGLHHSRGRAGMARRFSHGQATEMAPSKPYPGMLLQALEGGLVYIPTPLSVLDYPYDKHRASSNSHKLD